MTVPVTENLGGNAGLFVEASGFCAVTTEGAVPMYDEKKLKFIPLYPEHRIQTAIAWKRNVPRTPAVKAFLRFCKEALADR